MPAARKPATKSASTTAASAKPSKGANPLLTAWKTPFEVAPFDAIRPEHFLPAYEKAMALHNAEIDKIANSTAKPTFKNTIDAMELSGKAMSRVGSTFWNLTGAHTNDALQAIEREMSPRLAAHWTAISSNADLFRRVDDLYKRRAELKLDAEQMRVLERTHLDFVRSGAKLSKKAKKRHAEIMQRLAVLGTQFGQNVLADEKAYELPLPSPEDRAGLPQFLIDAAAAAATERKSAASHVITLSRSLIEPFLVFSTRRDLREQAFKQWAKRGERGGETDNRDIVAEILALRRERAQLLGFDTFADYKLADTMAKKPEAVRDLLTRVWKPARERAATERDKLQAMAASEGVNLEIEPWDWRHYAEKVRTAEFAFDGAQTKPFMALERMIEAAFWTATQLFGVTFHERKDVPVYHPDVRVWEVKDPDGAHVALFFGDYFARPSKRSGAWMSAFRSQWKLGGVQRPVIVNVMNFAKAPAGEPTLLSIDDARTLFHEFGHGLHGMLSDVTYPSLSGTSVARDFVELPSQLYEHWLLTKEVLGKFARHVKTDKPMPKALVEKVRAAQSFNQGFATVEFLASAIVDIDFHSGEAAATDPMKAEKATLKRIGMPREIIMRHRTPHFQHVFSGDGYSAGYYSYLWSEVLDADAFAAFEETGNVFDPATAKRLRAYVYGAGGLRDEEEAYKAFRGRLPTVDGLLKKRGLAEV